MNLPSNTIQVISVTCLLLANTFSYSQDPEMIKKADEIKDSYTDYVEDPTFANLQHTIQYTFQRGVDAIICKELHQREILSLKNNCGAYIWTHHDNLSSITSFRNPRADNYRGGKLMNPNCVSNYSESIFSSDDVACSYYHYLGDKGVNAYFAYEKEYEDAKYLTVVYAADPQPTMEKVISFEIPVWLDAEIHEMNFENFEHELTEEAVDKGKKYTYTFKNLRPTLNEDFSFGPSYFEPHIVIVLKKYTNNDGSEIQLFNDVSHVYKWYSNLCTKADTRSDELKQKVALLIGEKSTDEEKIESIFYWIQDNIRYVAFEDGIMGFQPEEASVVLQKRYGDCKGMASLTKAMLSEAGYDARLTWVGTNHISPTYNYSIPTLANDNHMICTVFLNDQLLFLDATEEYVALNDYATRIQGRTVMIEDGEAFLLKEIPSFSEERNLAHLQGSLEWDGKESLVGEINELYKGEPKLNFLRGYSSLKTSSKEESLEKYLKSYNKDIKIDSVVTTDPDDRKSDFKISYETSINGNVVKVADEVFVDMNFRKRYSDFDIETPRFTDVDMDYKINQKDEVLFTIPEGYKATYIPDPVKKNTADFSVSLSYEARENQVVLIKEYKFPNGKISVDQIEDWNTTVLEMKKFYKAQVTLSKTSGDE